MQQHFNRSLNYFEPDRRFGRCYNRNQWRSDRLASPCFRLHLRHSQVKTPSLAGKYGEICRATQTSWRSVRVLLFAESGLVTYLLSGPGLSINFIKSFSSTFGSTFMPGNAYLDHMHSAFPSLYSTNTRCLCAGRQSLDIHLHRLHYPLANPVALPQSSALTGPSSQYKPPAT
jgi:hypothetical protein